MCAQWTWYKYDVTFIWHGCDFMSVCIFPLVSTCFFLSLFVLFSVWFYDFTSHFLCLILNFTFSFVHFISIQWNFFSVCFGSLSVLFGQMFLLTFKVTIQVNGNSIMSVPFYVLQDACKRIVCILAIVLLFKLFHCNKCL